jgi:ABC-type uncharacterized transport system ATPase subunit
MIRLQTLIIHRFRSFKKECRIDFDEHITAIIGKNGTGKTTLLNLLGCIWAWDFSPFTEEEFHISYAFKATRPDGTTETVHVELKNEKEVIQGGSGVENSDTPAVLWHERGLITLSGSMRQISSYKIEDGWADLPYGKGIVQTSFFGFTRMGTSKPPGNFLGTAFIPVALFSWFQKDELLNFHLSGVRLPSFRYMEDTSFLSSIEKECVAYPHHFLYKSDRWVPDRIIGRLLLERLPDIILSQAQNQPLPSSILLTKQHAPTLKEACELLQLEDIELQFSLNIKHPASKQTPPEFSYEKPSIHIRLPDGTRFPVARLSHGEKRFIGLLWYLSLLPHIAIIDELANGLHHSLVAYVIEKLKNKQAFLAIQDPLVLDHLTFECPEQVRQSVVLCESALDEEKHKYWTWRNCTEEEAADFYESWKIGIQPVSELLKTRGIW